MEPANLSAAELWAFVVGSEREAHTAAAAEIGDDEARLAEFMDGVLALRGESVVDASPPVVALATGQLVFAASAFASGVGKPNLEFGSFWARAYRGQADLMASIRRHLGDDEQRYVALSKVADAALEARRRSDPERKDHREFHAHATAYMLTAGAYPYDAQ